MRSVVVLSLILLAGGASAQQGVDVSTIDENYIDFPADGIDYPGCFKDLVASDFNKDGAVTANEYLSFVQTYGARICHTTDTLSLEQRTAFNSLACRCQNREGYADDCCIGSKAQISTAGASTANTKSRTQEELSDLIATCRVTDGVIYEPRGCDPELTQPGAPPPFTYTIPEGGAAAVAAPPPSGGLSAGELAGIIIGAIIAFLLLMLCCCCCVMKRRKRMEEEEEQVDKNTTITEDADRDLERQPQQPVQQRGVPTSPADSDSSSVEQAEGKDEPPVVVPVAAPGQYAIVEEDDLENGGAARDIVDIEEEEDLLKTRGSALIPPEDDNNRRRLRGEGEIVDPAIPHDKVVLRPPPVEEPEVDPDWDYPGRDINFPKDADEMSAGHVDHYEPDGGVHLPVRPTKEPLNWRKDWERPEVEDPDERDNRKHRIQAGLGEGEVWDKLGEAEEPNKAPKNAGGDVFDWVIQSALGVLDTTDKQSNNDKK